MKRCVAEISGEHGFALVSGMSADSILVFLKWGDEVLLIRMI